MLSWPNKDPDEYLDYGLDWSARLGTDKIIGSLWDTPPELTTDKNEFTDTNTVIWLSGGTTGATYTLTNHITTQGGRLMDQSAKLVIKDK